MDVLEVNDFILVGDGRVESQVFDQLWFGDDGHAVEEAEAAAQRKEEDHQQTLAQRQESLRDQVADEQEQRQPRQVERDWLKKLVQARELGLAVEVEAAEAQGEADEGEDEDVGVTKRVNDLLAVPDDRDRNDGADDVDEGLGPPVLVLDDQIFDDVDGEDVAESFLDVPQATEDEGGQSDSENNPLVAFESGHWDGEEAALGVPPPVGRGQREFSRKKKRYF